MKLKKLLVLSLSTMCAAVSLTGCNPSGYLTVCLASEPDSIDPALNSAVDGATMLCHLDAGLKRYNKVDGKLVLQNDLAESITKASAETVDHDPVYTTKTVDGKEVKEITGWEEHKYSEGTRYTVKLRSGLKWSNGEDLTADDFIYSWNRASGSTLAADYCYMFEPICDGVYHETDDSKCASLGIKKVDSLTFTIDVMVDVPYFDQLLAFPTFFPVHKATVEKAIKDGKDTGSWATDPGTYVSCGAYKLSKWKHNSYIFVEKSDSYWDKDNVKCPSIKFALSDDDAAMLASFEKGDYDLIDSVPNDQISTLKSKPEYKVEGQLGTYYACFNVTRNMFSKGVDAAGEINNAKIRRAIGLLIDRKYIVDEVGQADQIPANSFVAEGITEPDGTQFTSHNGKGGEYGKGEGKGYYCKGTTDEEKNENKKAAFDLLESAGVTVDKTNWKVTGGLSKIQYLYNTSSGHKAIAEAIVDQLKKKYNIEVETKNEEWNSFLNTRKDGNYDMARNGWIADYDDPSTFLSMWTTGSGNNDAQLGKGTHAGLAIYKADLNVDGDYDDDGENNLTWANSYDKLIDLSNKETDATKRFKYLHAAEDLLMNTGAICPIYFYTDIYMINTKVQGFFASPLGYKFFHYVNK